MELHVIRSQVIAMDEFKLPHKSRPKGKTVVHDFDQLFKTTGRRRVHRSSFRNSVPTNYL